MDKSLHNTFPLGDLLSSEMSVKEISELLLVVAAAAAAVSTIISFPV